MQPIFEEHHEKELKRYRQKFGTLQLHEHQMSAKRELLNNYVNHEPSTQQNSPIHSGLQKHKFSLSLTNLQTQRSLAQSSARKSMHESKKVSKRSTDQEYEFAFPKWISERNDFQKWKFHSDFDINLKIVSICKLETFKRDNAQKQIIASYLQKLSLFKLMPISLLTELAGRITYKEINNEQDQILCKIGEKGNCMFIIFQGTVKVMINDNCVKEFHDNEHLGRQALETDAPRNATLMASPQAHILILGRWDYQQCLNNLFKIERPKWVKFINQIHFFNNFHPLKIQRLCEELQGKFLSAKDCLYKTDYPIDNFYIVKHGILVKKVVVNLEKSNRWPISTHRWLQNTVITRQEITIKFGPETLLGYYEIVTQDTLALKCRTEEINALEDCFLLFITKAKFQEIFNADDQRLFRELFHQLHPTTFDRLIDQVKSEDEKKKQEYKTMKEAVNEVLKNVDSKQLEQKSRKYKIIVNNAKHKLQQYYQTKGIISTEIRQREMRSIYE